MFRPRQIAVFVLLLLLVPSLALADTVLLRNGQRIEGKIVGQSRTTVRIQTAGGTRSIPKANVRRIVYGGTNKAKEERERKRKEREERLKKLREERKKAQEERKKAEEEAASQEAEAEAERRRLEAERLRQLQESESSTPGDITLPGALTRSALLPGLGQLYQGRSGAGAAYLGSFILLAGATGGAIAHHDFTRKQYLAAAEDAFIYTPFFFDLIAPVSAVNSSTLSRDDFTTLGLFHQTNVARARAEMIEAGQVADLSRSLLLAFYLWNLTDTFLFHPGDGNTAFGLYLAPETAGLQFQYRF